MTEREFLLHFARVCLAQSRAISQRGNTHVAAFGWTLLDWAANARRDAQAITDAAQGDLFA